jgi:transaldolase
MATDGNALESLKRYSTVVADSGDVEAITAYTPQDATTNPSLILAASSNPKYAPLLKRAKELAAQAAPSATPAVQGEWAFDYLVCLFGAEILRVIPGRVSSEVDAKYSFDTHASVEKGKRIIAIYQELGFPKERVLIKLASTWEGIQAAKVLEAEYGIHCNCTLLFSFAQAVACAGEWDVVVIVIVEAVLGRGLRPPVANRVSPTHAHRGQGHPHLALCRAHPGLVQGLHRQAVHRRRGPRGTERAGHLQLLQEARLPHHRHGWVC